MSGSSGFTRPALLPLDDSSNGSHSENDDSDSYEIAVRSNTAEDALAERYSSQDKEKDYQSLVQAVKARDTKSA